MDWWGLLWLILGIFGGVLPNIVIRAYNRYKANRSQYSGEWRTFIYNEQDEVVKEDILQLKHNPKTDEISGTIRRDSPQNLRHRNWVFKGVFTKEAMLVVFWSKEAIASYGVEYLVLVDDYTYQGYYLKHEKDRKSPVRWDIQKVKIVNKKMSNEKGRVK